MRRYLLAGTAALALAALAAWLGHIGYQQYREQQWESYLAAPIALAEPTLFLIRPQSTVSELAGELAAAGIVAQAPRFAHGMSRLGLDRKVKAGQYRLTPGTSHLALMEQFVSGKVVQHKFAIIEGTRFADVVAALAGAEHLSHTLAGEDAAGVWRAIAPDSEYPSEGMLYPDTYVFQEGMADLALLRQAHRRLLELLAAEWDARAPDLTLKSPYEALILASLIEKETGRKGERDLISSVFHNRLRIGMRLQSDPTVIYGLGAAFDGNLTKAHLAADTPYNSYTRAGLPPTPIAITSIAALRAALHPATSDYLYFVADNTGGHHFSKSLREHNNAVNRYQRKRR